MVGRPELQSHATLPYVAWKVRQPSRLSFPEPEHGHHWRDAYKCRARSGAARSTSVPRYRVGDTLGLDSFRLMKLVCKFIEYPVGGGEEERLAHADKEGLLGFVALPWR